MSELLDNSLNEGWKELQRLSAEVRCPLDLAESIAKLRYEANPIQKLQEMNEPVGFVTWDDFNAVSRQCMIAGVLRDFDKDPVYRAIGTDGVRNLLGIGEQL